MLAFINKLISGNKKNKSSGVRKILLIEDNEIDRKVVSKIIKKQGWDILIADNGKQGIVAAKDEIPDVILMDCEMPVMGGIDACRVLKETDATRDIPVIFLTSNDIPGNIVDCFDADAENYIHKPVDSRILVSFINKIFEND